jgi:hypothetical protein
MKHFFSIIGLLTLGATAQAQSINSLMTMSAHVLPIDSFVMAKPAAVLPLQAKSAPATISNHPSTAGNVVFPSLMKDLPNDALEYTEAFGESRRAFVLRTYSIGKKWFAKVNKIFKKQNVPTELRVLLAMESYFRKDARSPVGAVGYWQFMDYAAKDYGLNIEDSAKDERMDFNKSTKAAARYLRDRYRNLDNWLLAVASYNWGEGNVRKALARTGKSNPDVWDIKDMLPRETKNYVLNFVALNILFNNMDQYRRGKLVFAGAAKTVAQPTATPAKQAKPVQ